jgi:DNA-binding transcriptional regulator LsrR (DeoR family)
MPAATHGPHGPNGPKTKRPVEIAQLRLIAKVARMYHERGVRQPQIAAELSLSQARVSRLLRQASEIGVVRTVVTLPPGVYTDLEEQLQGKFNLRDAVVVDVDGAGGQVTPALGAATAQYLNSTLTGGEALGVSSWSATLLAATEVMPARSASPLDRIVQIVGGHGDASVQVQANRLTGELAAVTGARPVFLPAPGLVSSPALRRALAKDQSVGDVMKSWKELDLALVGIGSLEPSPLLRQSGNALTAAEQDELRNAGAVGDVCLRFFDTQGATVKTALDERVMSITPADLLRVPRRVGVAGGASKHRAIRAALRGGWVNVLVTDLDTARALLDDTEASPRLQQPAQLPELKAASKEACGGSKSNCRRNVIASAAPRSRSMPASSHSIEIGPA